MAGAGRANLSAGDVHRGAEGFGKSLREALDAQGVLFETRVAVRLYRPFDAETAAWLARVQPAALHDAICGEQPEPLAQALASLRRHAEDVKPSQFALRYLAAMLDSLLAADTRFRAASPLRALWQSDALAAPAWLDTFAQRLTALHAQARALLHSKARATVPPPLRPPGALPEGLFKGVCLRCGNCAQACPSHIIQPDFGASGIAGWLTPRLRFEEDYCREDCHRCGQVLPERRNRAPVACGKTPAHHRAGQGGPGLVPLGEWPRMHRVPQALPLQGDPHAQLRGRFFERTASGPGQIAPPGCGACEAACPVRPRRAIRVQASIRDYFGKGTSSPRFVSFARTNRSTLCGGIETLRLDNQTA